MGGLPEKTGITVKMIFLLTCHFEPYALELGGGGEKSLGIRNQLQKKDCREAGYFSRRFLVAPDVAYL